MGNAIHTENLTRDFGSVMALDNLSLEVPVRSLGLLDPTSWPADVLGFDTRTETEDHVEEYRP